MPQKSRAKCRPGGEVPVRRRTRSRQHPRRVSEYDSRRRRPAQERRPRTWAWAPAATGKQQSDQQYSHSILHQARLCRFRVLMRGFSFLRRAQNLPQCLPHNDFLPGLYGHRNQFDMVGFLVFFAIRIRIAFADRRHQAGIVRAEHFDHGIVFAQLAHAVG